MKFLEVLSLYVLFIWKGGVGKNYVACATALHLSFHVKRVLLVSIETV